MDVYQHFGLTGPPFSVQPDPKFAYATSEHQLALVKIQYSVQERRGLFLLQGEIGTGKSTLARFLFDEWSQDPNAFFPAYLTSTPSRGSTGFLRSVLEAF